jgi:hypothetical protein
MTKKPVPVTMIPLDDQQLAQLGGAGQPEPVPWRLIDLGTRFDVSILHGDLLRPPPLPWIELPPLRLPT